MADWSREDNEIVMNHYVAMLLTQFRGEAYSKAEHLRDAMAKLPARSKGSIEYKHENISAIMREIGIQMLSGYAPLSGYQKILREVVTERVANDRELQEEAARDARQAVVVPQVSDILSILTRPPKINRGDRVRDKKPFDYASAGRKMHYDYQEQESRNARLGAEGEQFVLRYEKERLLRAGKDDLASRIEHASQKWGDGVGFDVFSFETDGSEKLIEVKTTKYLGEASFYVSENELNFSVKNPERYHLYRLYKFREDPKLFVLRGSLKTMCGLHPTNYEAWPL